MAQQYLEVWGDTVDSRHLLGSIGLGVGIAVPIYLLSDWGFDVLTGGDVLAHSYALVAGLGACVLAAVVAARLFKPKRIIQIGAAHTSSREAAMDAIEAEMGLLGNPDELSPSVLAELKELGLYEDLRAQHNKNQRNSAKAEAQ